MSKHTPGPWTAHMSKYREGVLVVQAGMPSMRILADFGTNDALDEIDHANAHLIAAAPDLLAELETLCNLLDGCGIELPPEIECQVSFARAAISKATGESHD